MTQFALLVINQKSGESGCSKRRVKGKSASLVKLCQERKIARVTICGTKVEIEKRLMDPSAFPPRGPVLIAGSPSAVVLASTCELLRLRGHDPIIVVDALDNVGSLRKVLAELDEKQVQIIVSGGVPALVSSARHFIVNRFAKPDCTATIAVFIGYGIDTKVLVIKRKLAPYKGWRSLPGGFLKVFLEDLTGCARRELKEECSLRFRLKDFVPVDFRSSTRRDKRGHVIDHGYAVYVQPADTERVLKQLAPKDDAGEAEFLPVQEVLAGRVAFDHKKIIEAALKLAPWASNRSFASIH